MADLNTLLRWAVENTPQKPEGEASNPADMQLQFKPVKDGESSSAGLAVHPSDSGIPAHAEPAPSEPPKKDNKLSTEMLDLIMGKPDSVTMKEKMDIATNLSVEVEERVDALDDFEMLIELIDNANNMAVLKLWPPLISLFDDKSDEVVRHALWIAGTAVQNNLKGQAALFVNDASPHILDKVTTGPPKTRAKAVYALSSAIKHWPLAAAALSENNNRGYAVLRNGLADEDAVIRRKVAFLLGTLVMQAREKYDGASEDMPSEVRNLLEERTKASGGVEEDLLKALEREGVLAAAVAALKGSEDIEFDENAVRALGKAAELGALSAEEKKATHDVVEAWGPKGREERGLAGSDGEIVKAFA